MDTIITINIAKWVLYLIIIWLTLNLVDNILSLVKRYINLRIKKLKKKNGNKKEESEEEKVSHALEFALVGSVVRSLRHDKTDKNGWSFNYKFIQRITTRARKYYDVSMEDVDAILLSLADEQ